MAKASTSDGFVIGLALACAGALSACSAVPPATHGIPVDPSSPVAADVGRAVRHPGPYPTFAGIPQIPTDVRPSSSWRAAIGGMQQRQATLDAQVKALPPVAPETTESYAAAARARLGQPPGDVPPEDARARTEAEARALRERATPPPPPK